MIRRQSLRTRLLAIVLVGVVGLTAVNILISMWGLRRVRDRAVANTASAQQQWAEGSLQTLAHERADAIFQRLNAVERLAIIARQYLTEVGAPEHSDSALPLRIASDGRRYYQGKTTLLLPAGDDQVAPDDGAANQTLETLFPMLGRELPEIVRISYLTPRGSMRTYPQFDLTQLRPRWTAQEELGYQAGALTSSLSVKWTNVHPSMVGDQRVISAVAPVHQSGRFTGVVVIDISLENLTAFLKRLTVTQTGFAFLINNDGRLVAAAEQGQMQLIGHVMSPADVGIAAIDIPSLAPGLAAMRSNSSGVATADVRGRPFVLAYAGIAPLQWSLGLLAPVEEITARTATTTVELTSIAGETQVVGLLTSLAALALLVLILTYGLSHWLIRPLASLTAATASVAAGDLRHIKVAGGGEIGRLADSFNQMTGAVQEREAALQNLTASLEQRVADRRAELEQAIAQLGETTSARDLLSASIRDLSCPVVPVLDGILVMPLVGVIDTERAALLLSTLLSATERHRARMVIVDVTGVPIIDTQVARVLLKVASAIRLLGAETVLVGLRPELAQTIIGLGLDLTSLVTRADLQSAVSYALQRGQHSRSLQ